jgi:uncharacterized protein (DUF1697 family)
MPRYAAFLRGINVGGTRITNQQLKEPFAALGFENVETFRAAGNLVFDAPRTAAAKLAKQIEERLADDLGFTKAVTFLRTAAEMRALAAADPIPRRAEQKLHVMFLLRAPDPQVLEFASPSDPLALGPKEVFWGPEGRMTDSEIDLKAMENLVGPWTMRTKGTVDEIAARYFSG